jgi:hypothetical protein
MSTPRLGFMDNFACWMEGLVPLGIVPTKVTGAFWGQCLQRVITDRMDKAEYILTIDYDTFFTKRDVELLFALAMTFQCDALTGFQSKRDDGRPMITLLGTQGNPPEEGKSEVAGEWFGDAGVGTDPVSGRPVVAKDGKFGTYVTDGEINASLGRGDRVEDMLPERAFELLVLRREYMAEKGITPKSKGAARKSTSKKAAAKKPAAKKAPAKKAAAKKAPAKKAAAKKPAAKKPVAKTAEFDSTDVDEKVTSTEP